MVNKVTSGTFIPKTDMQKQAFTRQQKIAQRLKMAREHGNKSETPSQLINDELDSYPFGYDEPNTQTVAKFQADAVGAAYQLSKNVAMNNMISRFGKALEPFFKIVKNKLKTKGFDVDTDLTVESADDDFVLRQIVDVFTANQYNMLERYGILLLIAQQIKTKGYDNKHLDEIILKFETQQHQALTEIIKVFANRVQHGEDDIKQAQIVATQMSNLARMSNMPSLLQLMSNLNLSLNDTNLVTQLLQHEFAQLPAITKTTDYGIRIHNILRFEWVSICLNSLIAFILESAVPVNETHDMTVNAQSLSNFLIILNGQINTNTVSNVLRDLGYELNDESITHLRHFVATLPIVYFKSSADKFKMLELLRNLIPLNKTNSTTTESKIIGKTERIGEGFDSQIIDNYA